jgi:uncharacterized protein YxjI
LSWGPTYELHRGDELAAVVKKHLFTLFRCRFTVDVSGPDDLEAAGSFLDREYDFSRGGQVVATVSKRWFTWSDTYGVEIAEGEDAVLILASTVVIDMICHADTKD